MLVRALYTLVLTLAAPLLLFGLYRSKPNKPKFGQRWKEHFGITPALTETAGKAITAGKPIWIHAVSVGECIAATPLIKAIKAECPEQTIVVTTTTSTGAEQIEKLGDLVEHRYMPIDFSFAVRGFLRTIQPEKMLIIETELWPNTLHTVHSAGIPIIVVNARLSEKSCLNYARLQPLFNLIQPCLSKVLCQSQADAERFARLGIQQEKLEITGSIKFDIQISDTIKQKGKELRGKLGNNRPIWIAASTHKGEDELLLAAHQEVLKQHPNALMILVPRHPERFNAVFELSNEAQFKTVRRTSNETVTEDTQVYLGDTMGEMLILMGAADISFIGGSLLGDKVGGHNVLEPAALGVPVITGPSYFNFKEITDELVAKHGIWLKSADELSEALITLFEQPHAREQLIAGANKMVTCNQGALKQTLQLIRGHFAVN
ncbi:Lipid IV(A) 3-deoxy-D-manno-octulosonic acid transferase [Vibrio scophthalmi]|uniref:lipid IV(A) 3-deoxy-D-manno-octulosonic acid transferase n=1 Tax=Vibrio scophthalmi TaxID=45658 RepID=UPI00080938F4|nr:lipid IV(A) 3-deoxy-D-manno-octulosonic acid transferase [Vibrio scophthalmi]ANS84169.1 Lipid IV(A) 3-deoxy-D-manno-octulosonic acid transferase [Vibrio scophthalmi]